MMVVRSLSLLFASGACFLSQAKLRTVKAAREHIINRNARVQETTDTEIRGRENGCAVATSK